MPFIRSPQPRASLFRGPLAEISENTMSIPAVMLIGLFAGSAVTFALNRLRSRTMMSQWEDQIISQQHVSSQQQWQLLQVWKWDCSVMKWVDIIVGIMYRCQWVRIWLSKITFCIFLLGCMATFSELAPWFLLPLKSYIRACEMSWVQVLNLAFWILNIYLLCEFLLSTFGSMCMLELCWLLRALSFGWVNYIRYTLNFPNFECQLN